MLLGLVGACFDVSRGPKSSLKRFKMDGNVPVSSSDDNSTQKAGVIPKMSFASVCLTF